MQSYRKLKLGEAWRSLAPGQRFSAFLGAVAGLTAAAVFGAVVAGNHDRHELDRKESHTGTLVEGLSKSNASLEQRFASLAIEATEFRQRQAVLETSLAASRSNQRVRANETQFLTRYIAYSALSGAEAAAPVEMKPLVDALCTLWTSKDKPSPRFDTAPLQLTAQDFDQGRLPPDVQTLLVENFISLDPLREVRVADAALPGQVSKLAKSALAHQVIAANSTTPPALSTLSRQAQAIKIVKSVTLLDGAKYEIARPIAVALQIRRECQPR
jgi:hypothetical protein